MKFKNSKMILIKNFTKQKLNQKYLNKIAEKTLKVIGIKKSVEISLVITGTKRIKFLNKKYRNRDKITDVLSFGNEKLGNKSKEFINPPNNILYLGEIFICYLQAKKQAREKNHSVKKEIAILFIHGILHLVGYDHKGNYENSNMKLIEVKILKNL